MGRQSAVHPLQTGAQQSLPLKRVNDMSFSIGNRDENGVLIGSFKQARGSYPIDIVRHIVPFLFPCQQCRSLVFHVVGEQHAGIGIKLPFASKPLVSVGKGFHAICNTCTMINTQIPRQVVEKLERGVIPLEISNMYATVCNPPEPYTDGFLDVFLALFSDSGERTLAFARKCLEFYHRESTPV
jgi:hypothetical protein